MAFRESERLGSLKASLPRILTVHVAFFDWIRVVFSAKMGHFAPAFFTLPVRHFSSDWKLGNDWELVRLHLRSVNPPKIPLNWRNINLHFDQREKYYVNSIFTLLFCH